MKQFEFWHDHAGVSVPHLEEAIAWYQRVLGFEVERRIVIESIPAKVAIMINGNLRFEIFEPTGGKAPTEVRSVPDEDVRIWGNKHVCFGVDKVLAVGEELKRRQADIVWIKQFPNGGANTFFLRDNAGNLIEFVQRTRPVASHASL